MNNYRPQLPKFLTVKALAQRWNVDRDFIAGMIRDGTLETYVSYAPPITFNMRNMRGYETTEAGIYRLSGSGFGEGVMPSVKWVNREAYLPAIPEWPNIKTSVLPTKKEALAKLLFKVLLDVYEPAPDPDPQHPQYCIYPTEVTGHISAFQIHRDTIEEVEKSATAEEIEQGQAGKAVASRRILLTVVAALCKKVGIDPKERDATRKIMQMLELEGTPASEHTIRDAIKEIPEAVRIRKTVNGK